MCRQALVKLVQASQVHPSSKGLKSLAKILFLNLISPCEVKAVPNLAVLVGKTQSNMSTPSATPRAKSTGQPTPIKYLGLLGGRASQHCLTVLKKSFFASPPDSPPMAQPEASTLMSSLRHIVLSSGSMPPWTMGNRVCLYGCLLASMFLLIQRIVLSLASAILGPTVVVLTTSSRAIMMSEPMSFWKAIESQGRMKISDWSQGDWNFTPASLISQSLPRETIWKPPESVRMFLFQLINLWSPPTSPKKAEPGLVPRWQVFESMILQSNVSICWQVMPFMAPLVPTGMQTGVRTSPWGRLTVNVRAKPQVASRQLFRGRSYCFTFLERTSYWEISLIKQLIILLMHILPCFRLWGSSIAKIILLFIINFTHRYISMINQYRSKSSSKLSFTRYPSELAFQSHRPIAQKVMFNINLSRFTIKPLNFNKQRRGYSHHHTRDRPNDEKTNMSKLKKLEVNQNLIKAWSQVDKKLKHERSQRTLPFKVTKNLSVHTLKRKSQVEQTRKQMLRRYKYNPFGSPLIQSEFLS